MMRKSSVVVITLASAVSSGALAHTNQHMQGSYLSGLLHTISVLDHLLVILSFSFMLGLSVRRGVVLWIGGAASVFCLSMLAGTAGPILGFIEPILAATLVAAIGIFLIIRHPAENSRLLALSGALVTFSHGYAHGMEAPTAGFGHWAAGAVSAFVVIMLVGFVATRLLAKHPRLG